MSFWPYAFVEIGLAFSVVGLSRWAGREPDMARERLIRERGGEFRP